MSDQVHLEFHNGRARVVITIFGVEHVFGVEGATSLRDDLTRVLGRVSARLTDEQLDGMELWNRDVMLAPEHRAAGSMLVGMAVAEIRERRADDAATEERLQVAAGKVEQFEARQQELLNTIKRLGNETPFPDEIKGWEGQRAKMVAEIGTLRARIVECEAKIDRMPAPIPARLENL